MLKSIINNVRGFTTLKTNEEYIKPFISPDYQQINVARLKHLNSLGLDLDNKSVLEFGAGIGDHSFFYLTKNCKVFATDGRKELADYISNRFGIPTDVVNVETELEKLHSYTQYDIIHCYGLLYHINNPSVFLEAIKDKSTTLLLETCVSSDGVLEGENFVEEDLDNPTQAVSGVGCRPTRSWIFNKLKQLYPFVYMPISQPEHHQFPVNWENLKDEGGYIRAVFIASKKEIASPMLSREFMKNYSS
ncbi:class I SAM-dependent methyltransferase [Chryseosolibacter indicus]|uniref:Methyltransferase domain-containing protein n=1 Tax=Chryseosolibacter indicus TaxID=2782351 RepID=A0ABS5VKQ7_9BACT|nr:methyltransferase domain-containing protein [Chryseosolibacter indicus]MBT1702028.1 methyltransferase domain-containing protein [Chryseosolibacter indicus]